MLHRNISLRGMWSLMKFPLAGIALAIALSCNAAQSASLDIPFDYSRSEIGLDVSVKGTSLYMMLDTGVDPSAIDIARAEALGLKIDRGAGGEASGEGNAKSSIVYPTAIETLAIAGRDFGTVDALAFDMSALSRHYGKPLDGILGYSFLNGKIVLIDYARRSISIVSLPGDTTKAVASCTKRWSIPLTSYEGDAIPIIKEFRFGKALAPISLDTGSSGGVSLYRNALKLPGVESALIEKGQVTSMGARGHSSSKTYTLAMPLGFGPFILPAGQTVALHDADDHSDPRVANVGNKLFAAMKLKMLLDYRNRLMTFYGGCR